MNEPRNGFAYIDSVQKAKDRPDSWFHPQRAYLERIRVGWYVKIGVADSAGRGERFWGIVTERSPGLVRVAVSQDLQLTDQHGIADGDGLTIRDRNVFGILDENFEPVWEAGKDPSMADPPMNPEKGARGFLRGIFRKQS